MRDDEDTADRLEQEHAAELAARKEEVDATITSGAEQGLRSESVEQGE